jgi:hypothetical protein
VFYFWDVCHLLLVFPDAWRKSNEEVKRGLSGGCAGPGIVNVLGNWQPLGPVILLEVAIDSEVLF